MLCGTQAKAINYPQREKEYDTALEIVWWINYKIKFG
jgi:hypothetical protein